MQGIPGLVLKNELYAENPATPESPLVPENYRQRVNLKE
jgi:hypothetical protein